MIENVEEYKEKENALKDIEKRLDLISKSQGEIDLTEVHNLRSSARVIASEMKDFINREFAN